MRADRAILRERARAVRGFAQGVRGRRACGVSSARVVAFLSVCIVLWCDTRASDCIMMLRVSRECACACVRACLHDITRLCRAFRWAHTYVAALLLRYLRGFSA